MIGKWVGREGKKVVEDRQGRWRMVNRRWSVADKRQEKVKSRQGG